MSQVVEEAPAVREWREITERKEEFQKILGLLVEFDERTGRLGAVGNPAPHFLRKAVSKCSPADGLHIYVQPLGENLYFVVVHFEVDSGSCVTAWVHEDGIRSERDTLKDNPNHPVHKVVCLTDLMEETSVLAADALDALPESVRSVMEESPTTAGAV